PQGQLRRAVQFEKLMGGRFVPSPLIRCARAFAYTALIMLAWWFILAPIFGEPDAPARGCLARIIYMCATIFDVVATLFLLFLVVDATLLCYSFIKRLTGADTIWRPETVSRLDRFGVLANDLDDWLDMQFLAKRTSCITQLIYFPFLALALMIVSRSQLFDA